MESNHRVCHKSLKRRYGSCSKIFKNHSTIIVQQNEKTFYRIRTYFINFVNCSVKMNTSNTFHFSSRKKNCTNKISYGVRCAPHSVGNIFRPYNKWWCVFPWEPMATWANKGMSVSSPWPNSRVIGHCLVSSSQVNHHSVSSVDSTYSWYFSKTKIQNFQNFSKMIEIGLRKNF